MRKCSECGAELAEGVKFCSECGTKVPVSNKCPECGTIYALGAKFCGECGHKLSNATVLALIDKEDAGAEEDQRIKDFFGEGTEVEEVDGKDNTKEDTTAEGTQAVSTKSSFPNNPVNGSSTKPLPYSDVKINADELRAVTKKFERRMNSGRVFFPGDEAFTMKCETLLKTAASVVDGLSVAGRSFTATDKTLYKEGDRPKVVSVDESDIVALFDNTKKGLFGGITKMACTLGVLVTTKGILTCNLWKGRMNCSGFVTWHSIALAKEFDRSFETGVEIFPFSDRKDGPYPRGPQVSMCLWNLPSKALESSIREMALHFIYISRGEGKAFNFADHMPETAEEAEEED